MGMRLNFAVWNNKQTFLHLDILSSSDYASIFVFCRAAQRNVSGYDYEENVKSNDKYIVLQTLYYMTILILPADDLLVKKEHH